jgi:glycine oxidase
METLIIGGGIIGLLTARELALAGESVTVIDRSELGTESSWAGGGIISPLYPWRYSSPVNQLARWSQQHYPGIAQELINQGCTDPEWTQSGLLVLDPTDMPVATQWAEQYGLECQRVDGVQAAELEPALAAESKQSLWFPGIAQIRNPRLVKSLREYCQQNGIGLVTGAEVSRLLQNNGAITGVQAGGREYRAEKVVITSGAWSANLLREVGLEVDINPVRGQMLMYRGKPGQVQHMVLKDSHYVIPRRDGRILVGSTLENVGFDKATTDEGKAELIAFAEALMPCFQTLPIERHWSGLRPGSPQGIPYISGIPGIGGLYLNSGHYRNVVILGPASARLMVDIILRREPIVNPAPYGLERVEKQRNL